MKKRILPIFLALDLCVGLVIPAFAIAQDFVIVDGVLTQYNGLGGDVSIPDNVTAIGGRAFADCTNLTNVLIPDSVTRLGQFAFAGCSNLTSITIPNDVYLIDKGAFQGCVNLQSATISNGTTTIQQEAFKNCVSLTDVTIPNSVTVIQGHIFEGCKSLTTVTIPDSLTVIGDSMFMDCTSLSSVNIPDSVNLIGANAFLFCDNLTDIYYGGSEVQWEAIENYDTSKALKTAVIHYNTLPSFTDVPDWCSVAVQWAVEKKITNGTGGSKFTPDSYCTNAMILTFLWRAAGEPSVNAEGPTIVPDSIRYADMPIRWATETDLISWDANPAFGITTPCSRADAVKFIWLAFGKPSASASGFVDIPADADYAKAVDWAVENGITNGTSETTFGPDETCTRGQIVTFLHRAYVEEARLTTK